MKKFLLLLIILLAGLIAAIYIFIPSQIKINKAFVVHSRPGNVYRNFLSPEGWNKWFTKSGLGFEEQGFVFSPATTATENNTSVQITKKTVSLPSFISVNPLRGDSVAINWSCMVEAGNSPIDRIFAYLLASDIKKAMDGITEKMIPVLQNINQSYGFTARLVKLSDSSMIATHGSVNHYPLTEDIYEKIGTLEKFAASQNASVTNFPMLHIQKADSMRYDFMVSLPINKRLSNQGEILVKLMLPNGNFISSDSIYGGSQKLDSLFVEFENFKKDYNFGSPAIPFQSLITDRRKEPDSSKWITKFYYPVF